MAGTPCPYYGKIGLEAAEGWANNPEKRPDYDKWVKATGDNKMNTPLVDGTGKLLVSPVAFASIITMSGIYISIRERSFSK